MKVKVQPRPQTITQARAELSCRLEARRDEIEAAVMTRVYSVSDTTDLDPTYAEGLKAAVTAAVDYGLIAIELGEDRSEPPPPILLAQARLAARAGVSLNTVLRRYFAGHALLGDFLIEEAEGGRLLRGAALQSLLRTQAALFDRLLEAVAEEHGREGDGRLGSSEQRRVEWIERLLDGELLDISELQYELEAFHIGLVASGPTAARAVPGLARALGRSHLVVQRDEETVWAWLGGRHGIDPGEILSLIPGSWPAGATLAVGELAQGLQGWRLSHLQAKAAMTVARRTSDACVRYAEVAMLAAVLRDDLLATSLRQLYLDPLARERDGGETLRETLRAYFAAERNVSSAAAALGVSRQTVAKRMRTIEKRLGHPLRTCAVEIESALRMEALDTSLPSLNSSS